MSIPLISNISFTEVNSEGTLNDKAGTSKSKLPIQLFKLTDNISGNLTLNNDIAHKKIRLDTNGNNVIVSASPLTTNSDVTLELTGTGNIQSSLVTFTKEETDTTFIGTSTITEANDSTINVSAGETITQHNTVTATTGQSSPQGLTFVAVVGGSHRAGFRGMNVTINGVTYNSFTSAFRQVLIDSNRSGNAWNGAIVTSSNKTATFGSSGVVSSGEPSPQIGDIDCRIGYNNSVGWFSIGVRVGINDQGFEDAPVGINGNSIQNLQIGQRDPDRIFTYTNNLSIPVQLTGNDPFDDVSVPEDGGTEVVTVTDSTDGSFNIIGTISGSDDSGQPYALVSVNNGTGTLDTTNYTGILSTRAF